MEFIPVQSKKYCNDGLVQFINEVGIPEHLVSDGALEQGGFGAYKTNWNATQRKYNMYQTFIQPHCPRQNKVELSIGHLSRDITQQTVRSCSPRRLWAYCGMFCASISQLTASTHSSAMGWSPFEMVHGYTPDITLYVKHDWYKFIYWFDPGESEKETETWEIPWTLWEIVWSR